MLSGDWLKLLLIEYEFYIAVVFDKNIPLELLWILDSTTSDDLSCNHDMEEIILCKWWVIIPLLVFLICCRFLYLDKLSWSISAKKSFLCIRLFPITWERYLVALIPWKMMLHQRHFHWLFSILSMRPSFQIRVIELST